MQKTKNSTLKESMTALRNATDYRLPLKQYTMISIDGHSFSKLIKNKYEKPFDDKFINIMNEVAIYICKHVEGCKFAYAQSDEITFVLTDFDTETTCAYFGNRLTKLLSIIPSMASAKFNQLVITDLCDTPCSNSDLKQMILDIKLADFDCKAWGLSSFNDVYAYYLWRQIDCIRNSKQQTAQTWLSHNQLKGLDTDEQIKLLFNKKSIDWNKFEDYKKFGRFIYKETESFSLYNEEKDETYYRNVWKVHPAFSIINKKGKERFMELGKIPILNPKTKKAIVKEQTKITVEEKKEDKKTGLFQFLFGGLSKK